MADASFTSSLENTMREELAGPRGGALPAEQRQHLSWMLDTLAAQASWPPDKRGRWVGFITGTLDNAADMGWAQVAARMLGPTALPVQHERLLATACADAALMLTLRASEDGTLAPLVHACWFARDAAAGSFWLGFLQAAMVRRGLINVQDERERTRGIFHDAYLACGWVAPESAEPARARPKP